MKIYIRQFTAIALFTFMLQACAGQEFNGTGPRATANGFNDLNLYAFEFEGIKYDPPSPFPVDVKGPFVKVLDSATIILGDQKVRLWGVYRESLNNDHLLALQNYMEELVDDREVMCSWAKAPVLPERAAHCFFYYDIGKYEAAGQTNIVSAMFKAKQARVDCRVSRLYYQGFEFGPCCLKSDVNDIGQRICRLAEPL